MATSFPADAAIMAMILTVVLTRVQGTLDATIVGGLISVLLCL